MARKVHTISFEVSEDLWRAVAAEAQRDDRSVSSVCRLALRRYLTAEVNQ